MADITLAEFDGSVWLVGGEAHIDDLLIGALPEGISIDFVRCEHKSEVHALWHRLSGTNTLAVDPWIIHPNIARRYSGAPPGLSVLFAPWIVMPDAAGLAVIAEAASSAAADPDACLVLSAHVDPAAGAAAAELAALRLRMIEEALARADVAGARISRAQQEATLEAGTGRVDILVQAAPG